MVAPGPIARRDVEARRQRILDAASCCARKAGFHGARMAEIASAAGLSVGQIYRYFENKEAIIEALIAQDVAEQRDKFAELERSGKPLVDAIVENGPKGVDQALDPERTALMLEVLAEASRNPSAAALLQTSDAAVRDFRLEVLREIAPAGCSDRELIARGEMVNVLFEGLTIRGLANPGLDRATVAKVLQALLRRLLTDAPCQQPLEDKAAL